mgnify:CR=1 FL=1
MDNWKSVYEDKLEYRATIVRDVLTDRGMDPVLMSKQDSAYNFGYYEVLVAPDHILRAIKIINDEIKFE